MSKLMRGRAITIGVVGVALLISAAAYFLLSQPPGKVYSSPTDLDITTNTTWTGNYTIDGTLTVKAGYTLTIDSSAGTQITVTATNLVVESGAYISANGKGSAGGAATADGVGTGKGLAGSASMAGGGAGYGGAGGDGFGNTASGGTTYGSNTAPTANGSGGGGGASDTGGAGGGAIKFVISGETAVNGTISANGANGTGATNGSGAGSGGSIYLTTAVLSGSGSITANGGNGVVVSGGLGGGGRVALYYNDKSNFSGTVTANKGTTGNGSGANGTSLDSPTPVAIYTGGSGSGYARGVTYFYYNDTTTSIWDGGGADNLASTAANWVGDTLPVAGNSIVFNDVSTKDCTWDLTGFSVANFTLNTEYDTGTVTLSQNLTVTNTITVNTRYGKLIDNGKTVNFKNVSIANSYRLTSTGTWRQTADGTISNPQYESLFNNLELAEGVTATLTGEYVWTKRLVQGANSVITGGTTLKLHYVPANDFIVQGSGAVIQSPVSIEIPGNRNQGALTATGAVTCYSTGDYTLTMSGHWNIGGTLRLEGMRAESLKCTLDTNGYNLSAGTLLLGKNYFSPFVNAKILFKTGTHTIGGNFYVDGGSGASGGTCYTHGWIDFGSSTVNIGGNLDFRGASVTPGTST
ncbi:MAG: hypothetical protein PHC29_02810, partial [Candidatus Omnitrophica bacterium]|nr:hypothetical protein [Candidatus Omnitrophota bacterium]